MLLGLKEKNMNMQRKFRIGNIVDKALQQEKRNEAPKISTVDEIVRANPFSRCHD